MDRSLCILLPVHNDQATLVSRVVGVLEVVGDLTGSFEVLIVDDASNDATFELGVDLSRVYPQVAILRHGDRRGTTLALETGLRGTRAQIVVVHDPTDAQFDPSALVRLWQLVTRSPAEAMQRISSSTKIGTGRRGFSESMVQLAEKVEQEQQAQLEISFGGFRLCRPVAGKPSDRRYEIDRAESPAVVKPIQSPARQRIGRIRHLLQQDS